jgi:hypothetical protein
LRIGGRKLFSFSSKFIFFCSLSHVYLSLSLSFWLLYHGKLNYHLLGFRTCSWYFFCFDSNYVRISMMLYFDLCFDLSVHDLIIEWWITCLSNCKCLNLCRNWLTYWLYAKLRFETKYWNETLIFFDPNQDLEKWFH